MLDSSFQMERKLHSFLMLRSSNLHQHEVGDVSHLYRRIMTGVYVNTQWVQVVLPQCARVYVVFFDSCFSSAMQWASHVAMH